MDKAETFFLETKGNEVFSMVWIYRCFSFGLMDNRNFIHFMKKLIDVILMSNLHMSQVKRVFYFLILK